MRHVLTGLSLAVLLLAPSAGHAQLPATASANDYSNEVNWLCRPGRYDACEVDLTTAVIAADGSVVREPLTAPKNPAIDCFYVYPTVSTDQTDYSDMTPDRAELNAVAQQFARFGRACRLFAPSYRQATTAGLLRRAAVRCGRRRSVPDQQRARHRFGAGEPDPELGAGAPT